MLLTMLCLTIFRCMAVTAVCKNLLQFKADFLRIILAHAKLDKRSTTERKYEIRSTVVTKHD